ncbi:MAG: SDR family NAD(P)-dependent oxidoreductase [Chitinophagaceae bacterium]
MKTIIITGANGNLGTACVKKYLAEGYRVIAVDGSDNHLEFAAGNPAYTFTTVNLTDEAATNTFIAAMIARHGKIHGALMLVGGFAAGKIATTTGPDVYKMFSLNFETAYFMARPLLQHMQQNGYGRLIFIGARPALNPAQGKDLLAYALTKSLLFKLADFINEENKNENISAAVIVPSTIDTALNRKSMPDADPANWVTPEALADTMEFITSDKGSSLRETVLKVYNKS